MLITACGTVVPQSFTSQIPAQAAVTQTLNAFVAAVRAHDVEALNAVLTPDATLTYETEDTTTPPVRYSAVGRRYVEQSLLGSTNPVRLVNFQLLSPDRATVETFLVTTPTDTTTQTTQVIWTLLRQRFTWRVDAVIEKSWMRDNDIRLP
jgi:hypothetical protein